MTNSSSLEVGDSFEIEDANGKHLHFIIVEESEEDHSLIMLVYLSSSNTIYKDETTIIKPSEHPYITNTEDDSWIRYQNTIIYSRNEIVPLITKHYGKISDDLLIRIQQGFKNSNKVSKRDKKIYSEWKTNKLFDSL